MPKGQGQNLEEYATKLGELPFVKTVRFTETAARFQLVDGSSASLELELKTSHVGATAAAYLRSALSADPSSWLVAAPYIGGPLGAALEDRGINFVDRQGNCYLRFGERFVARVQGQTPPKAPARSKEMRAPGCQVMFALLADPDLAGATQRELAAAAGTSRQPVADLLARFVEEKILVKRQSKHAWVDGPDGALLDRWLAGYRATLRPKLLVGRFQLPVREPKAIEGWLDERVEDVRYGGTAGAYRLERHYRGPLTVAHLGPPSEEIRRLLKAAPAPDGDLLWMRHIGQASLRGTTDDTVHPLLIHAELVSDPDPRADEAAELVRDRWLSWSL